MTDEESWQPIADTLGFANEEEMLRHLYTEQNFSIRDISSVVGYSAFVVRTRLMRMQPPVVLKKRGGKNRQGKRSMISCTDEELAHGSVATLAEKYNVHPSTVSAERRLRERLKEQEKDELLRNRTAESSELLPEALPPHDSGPVFGE